jgi:hypothetical protein
MKENKETSAIAAELGRRGGKKTLEKHGKDHYKRISDMAVKAKREKKLKEYLEDENQPLVDKSLDS